MTWWNATHNGVDIAKKWAVLPKYLDCYVRAYEVLTDEETVSRCLVEIARSATTLEGIKAALAKIERENGFSDCVVTVYSLKQTDIFMGYILARRPLQDLGAGWNHGSLTHRIQWAILAKTLKLPPSVSLSDIYSALGETNAYVGYQEAFWKDLVDSEFRATRINDLVNMATFERKLNKDWVYNARSPEFLMLYMQHHRDRAVRELFDYSYREAKLSQYSSDEEGARRPGS